MVMMARPRLSSLRVKLLAEGHVAGSRCFGFGILRLLGNRRNPYDGIDGQRLLLWLGLEGRSAAISVYQPNANKG
jgi:hypothetical protein